MAQILKKRMRMTGKPSFGNKIQRKPQQKKKNPSKKKKTTNKKDRLASN